jgi:hypothetical protein
MTFLPPALEDHVPSRREMDAHVGAVDFLFDDERFISQEPIGVGLAEMLVVIRSARAE